MDPTAVFVHRDRKPQTLAESAWQKVGIDRVSQVSFDATGRLCAIYYAMNAIELWDFSSTPVPMSSLVLPKLASGRYDGYCYGLTWSYSNTHLVGVFGSRNISRTKSSAESETNLAKIYRPYQLVVWDVCQRVATHMLRLPFGVKTIQSLGLNKCLITSVYGNCLFELNLENSTIRELCCPIDCLESAYLTVSPPYSLFNAFGADNVTTEGPTAACDVPIDAFAAYWFAKCASFNENLNLFETIATSAVAVDLAQQVFYFSKHYSSSPSKAAMLCKVDFSTSTYTITATTVLNLPCPVLTLSVDPQLSIVCATGTNGHVKLYSTDLVPLGDQLLLDREITEILNAQGTSTKQPYPGTGRTQTLDHKKVLPVTYSANTEYKCMGVAFYTYTVPRCSDNTRYSNNLTHHDLLYPDGPCTVNKHSVPVSAHLHSAPQRTGLLYSVQGHSKINASVYSEHMILFDLDLSPASTALATATSATTTIMNSNSPTTLEEGITTMAPSAFTLLPRKVLVKGLVATALPKASVAEFIVSPLQTTTYTSYSQYDTTTKLDTTPALHTALSATTSRCSLPKQTILSVDEFGRLWSLRPHYKSDFPGPMYPIGYTLINKVVQYVETEEELDVVVVPDSHSGINGTSSSDSLSKDSLVYSNNSSKRDINEAFGEPTSNTDHTLPAANNSAAVADLVISNSKTPNSTSTAKLPFTFVEDYLRSIPANGNNNTNGKQSSATSGVRRGFTASVGSPLRARPDLRAALPLSSPDGGSLLAEPISNNNTTSSNGITSDSDLPYVATDSTVDAVNHSTDASVQVWAVDDFLNAPVRIQSGDFENKLARNANVSDLILHTLTEPQRVQLKLAQIQEEAVAAVRHAEEVNQRKLARNLAKKQEKLAERAKMQAEMAVQMALGAPLQPSQQSSQSSQSSNQAPQPSRPQVHRQTPIQALQAQHYQALLSQIQSQPQTHTQGPGPGHGQSQSQQSSLNADLGFANETRRQFLLQVQMLKAQFPNRDITDAQWHEIVLQDWLKNRNKRGSGGANALATKLSAPTVLSAPAIQSVTPSAAATASASVQALGQPLAAGGMMYEPQSAHLMHNTHYTNAMLSAKPVVPSSVYPSTTTSIVAPNESTLVADRTHYAAPSTNHPTQQVAGALTNAATDNMVPK